MSLPPTNDDYVGEPQYPSPWTTKRPREGLRDNNEARIVSLAPDVCKTPIGSSTPPIPYPVVDFCGHDANYTESVRFTGQRVMVLRSNTTHVHGDKPGKAKGVKSGTVGGICEPIEGADEVRAEGSPIICHLHRFKMNNGNTEGEAIFVRNTETPPPPKDDDPIPGSLRLADKPILLAQNATGTAIDAGGGLFGQPTQAESSTRAPTSASPKTDSDDIKRLPLKRYGLFGIALGEILRDASMSDSDAAAEKRAFTVLFSPTAEQVIREQKLLAGHQTGSMFSANYWDTTGKYGWIIDPEERVPLANDILSNIAGKPMDVRTMTDEQVGQILAMANKKANANTAKKQSVRVTATGLEICFDLPPGMDRKEFEKQLKEQENTINGMTADKMGYAQWVLRTAGSTRYLRDRAAQESARQAYENGLIAQGKTASQIKKIMGEVNATHFLDMVAGGDPSKVGIGMADVNQEIGRQWIRDGRVQALRDEAEKMRKAGRGDEEMNVKIDIC